MLGFLVMQAATLATGERHLLSPALPVAVDDHTFLMSILKHFLSREISRAPAPSESFGAQRLNSSEVGPVRLRAVRCWSRRQIQLHHPLTPDLPKAGRTGVCLSCFSSFSVITIPCLTFQSLIGLETYSHSTGEREKKKIPTPLPDSSVCFHLLLQASGLLCYLNENKDFLN